MKNLFVLSLALIALAVPAHADPITAAVAWIGNAMAQSAIFAAVVQTAIGMGVSLLAQAIMGKPEMPGADVELEIQIGDDLPLSFTVGDFATSGKRKYVGSWGRNTRFVTQVIEFSALPQGAVGIWVDDEAGEFVAGQRAWIGGADPSDDRSWTEGPSVPSGSIDIGQPLTNLSDDGNRIVVKFLDGTQTAADPFLTRVFGDDEDYPWTEDMVGVGKSYAIVTVRYDDDTLTSYPSFLIEPEPLALYDLRFDSTNGGSGTQRWENPATWQPTRNPAVIAYNIIRGIRYGTEWIYGGRNLPAWRLPAAEWIAAANECDDPVSLSSGGTEPRYRCGLEIKVDTPPADYLEEIGKAANMKFAEVGGQIKPIVGLPGSAVFSFTDDDILITEGQSFQPFYPASETFNTISATYPEPREKWATKDAKSYTFAEAQEDDGGRFLPVSVSYPAAPFAKQVQRLLRSQMRDFRRMRRHQFHLPPDAYALEPGVDLVSWSSDRNGYANKLFMVESVAKSPGMNVMVSLREVNPGDYDWSSDFESPVTITVPKNPVRFVQPISGLAVFPVVVRDTDGAGRRPAIRVSCDGDEAGVTNIQIQARVLGEATTIDTTRRFGGDYVWYLSNVLPLTAYEVRARLLSDLTPKSAWSPWLSVITLKAGYTTDDIADEVLDSMRDIAAEAGIDAVDVLPATGEPNQIVMKVPEGVLYRWDEVAGDWSTQIYAGIPDGAIDIAKFAEGIEPVSIITSGSLPTAKTTEAIFWQGKLYRWSSGAYTAAVPSSDLTGQITGTQITNGAVTTPKLAAGAVDADKIAANAITAGKVAAGAIGADQIAAQAIVASKLVVSDYSNLVLNNFTGGDFDGWGTGSSNVSIASVTGNGIVAGFAARVEDDSSYFLASPRATASFGENFYFEVYTFSNGIAGAEANRLRARVHYEDGSVTYHTIATTTAVNSWVKLSGNLEIPANAVSVQAWIAGSMDGGTGAHSWARPVMRRAASGELIVDGAITAGKVAAGAITTNSIAAGAIVASKIASGAVTADKILANSVTSTQINVAQLVGSSAFLNNLSVGSAQIENAAITAAKISNLAVDTIKIANGAVSSFERSFTSGSITIQNNQSAQIQGLAYTIGRTGPQTLFVAFDISGSTGSPLAFMQVFRVQNGTETEVYREDIRTSPQTLAIHRLVVDGRNSSNDVIYRVRILSQGAAHTVSSRFVGALNVFK